MVEVMSKDSVNQEEFMDDQMDVALHMPSLSWGGPVQYGRNQCTSSRDGIDADPGAAGESDSHHLVVHVVWVKPQGPGHKKSFQASRV
jgi:hypothetical protein